MVLAHMIGSALAKLIEISDGPMALWTGMPDIFGSEQSPTRMLELTDLLSRHNGFMAFRGAMHVFPAGQTAWKLEIGRFNSAQGWRNDYWHKCQGIAFFGTNVFGDLYGFQADRIVKFDPEIGEASEFAENLESWASQILADWSLETGYPVISAWQDANSLLPEGKRLMPVQLFALGGTNAMDNLKAISLVDGLAVRGSIASQIRDLPDGSKVHIRVV